MLKNPMTQAIIAALISKFIGSKLGGAAQPQAAGNGASPGGIDLGGILGGILGGGGQGGGGGIDLGKILGGVLGGGGGKNLVGQLTQGGLGDQLQSWIGTGANQPATPQQFAEAIGPDTINEIAAETGATPEQVSETISQVVPEIVNESSPNGQLDPAALQTTLSKFLGS